MLKSRFFQSLDLGSDEGKEFARALQTFAKLPLNALEQLASDLPRLLFIKLEQQQRAFITQQISNLGISYVEADHAVNRIMRPLVDLFNERLRDEDPSNLVDDVVEPKLLTGSESKKALQIFRLLKDKIAPELMRLRR